MPNLTEPFAEIASVGVPVAPARSKPNGLLSALLKLGLVVAGVVCGAVGTLRFGHSGSAFSEPAARHEAGRSAPSAEQTNALLRVRELERRLAKVEQQGSSGEAEANQSSSTGPGSEKAAKEESPSEEEWAEHHRQLHAAAMQAHQEEGRDPEWAPATETTLARDLAVVGQSGGNTGAVAALAGAIGGEPENAVLNAKPGAGFDVVGVECKTVSCAATLRWKSYGDAVSSFANALHFNYGTPCGTRILLPEPTDKTRSYDATLIFDCEDARVNN